jgi:6-pyruvoyltetrahydropterin/6-carboxytetrahydropterin synthase
VFEISVQTEFAAAHALSIAGVREPVHGHNWHVTVTLTGATLDEDGLLCDFHTVESTLKELTGKFHNRNLNEIPPFDVAVNPSAENVARYLAEELSANLEPDLAPHAAIASVRVTEAPGCAATYRLPQRTTR